MYKKALFAFFFIYFVGDVMYLIADGGMSSLNVSNTMDAIMLTKNLINIDGIKLDVWMTLDNVLVLSRYNDLSKDTFSNKKITEVDYTYLKKVKFQSHIFKYYIPKLEEVLKKYNKKKILLLELHCDRRKEVFLYQLLEICRHYPYKYYFYSEDDLVLQKLKSYHLNILSRHDIIKDNELDKITSSSIIVSSNPLNVLKGPLFDK